MSDPVTLQIPSSSLQYVHVPVRSVEAGVDQDPTGDAVEMAVVRAGATPQAGDWKSATWETTATGYLARILVGPGGDVELQAGEFYRAWVRVDDAPEAPVMRAASWISVIG